MFAELYALWKREDLLSKALKNIDTIFEEDKEMFVLAYNSLITNKDENAEVVEMREQKVDSLTCDTRKKIAEYLATHTHPDISASLVLTSVIVDLERIGDISLDIQRLELLYPKDLEGGTLTPELNHLHERILQVFDLTQEAFRDSKPVVAEQALNLTSSIETQCKNVFEKLWNSKKMNTQEVIVYALTLRYFVRVTRHLHNIATSVTNPFHRIGYVDGEES